MKYSLFCCVITSLLISSCATIISGTTEKIKVTSNHNGAVCTLSNNRGSWQVTTPGTVVVHRSKGDLTINCTKWHIWSGRVVIKSRINPAVAGNLLMPGGTIGGVIDASDGAAFKYPPDIKVPMRIW